MKPSSMACFIEYRLNASKPSLSLLRLPNSSSVLDLGVAVKANMLIFSWLFLALICSLIRSS